MGRYSKYANAVKEATWRAFNRKDGAPTVALRVGVDEGDTYPDGSKKLNGLHLLFQSPKNIRMLLAPQSDGRALVVHMLEAMLQKLESMITAKEQAAQAAQPVALQKASIRSVSPDTYAGNDLGPINMGDWVSRKGQTERYQVTALRILNGTTQAKTDRPNSRWTNLDRFEHAREVTPEPVAPAGIDAAALQDIVTQTVAAILAARQ